MRSEQKSRESLQQRVNSFLHVHPVAYAVEEPKHEAVEAIASLLKRAEEELDVALHRVNRLKWELERARS